MKAKKYLDYLIFTIGVLASITGIVSFAFDPKYKTISLVIAISLLVSIGIIIIIKYIIIKVKKIKELEVRLAILEKTQRVPFFKKWPLIYSHLWNSGDVKTKNPIDIEFFEVKDVIQKGGRLRDASVQFFFKGVFVEDSWNLNLSIGGDEFVRFDKINLKAIDIRSNEVLKTRIADKGRDLIVKDIIVSFQRLKRKGDYFELLVSWKWPRMLHEKSDFIALSNIFSNNTNHIKLILQKEESMEFQKVEAYEYGIQDDIPKFIRSIYPDKDNENMYVLEIIKPKADTDYILYYES